MNATAKAPRERKMIGYRLRNLPYRLRPSALKQEVQALLKWGARTELAITVFRADGTVEDYGVVSRQMLDTSGVTAIANAFLNTFELELFNFHGAGTTATGPAIGDTALVAEVETRGTGTQSSPSGGQYRTIGTVTATAGRSIVEHGIFSASTVGTLLDRSTFTAVALSTGDSIQFTFTLTFTAGG